MLAIKCSANAVIIAIIEKVFYNLKLITKSSITHTKDC